MARNLRGRGRVGCPGRAAVAVLAAALVPLAACAATPSAPAQTGAAPAAFAASFTEAPCPSPNVPGVPQLDLGPRFRCGYLTVPENRAALGDRTVRIAVARIPAASPTPKPDPLVFLTGGPGGTAIATAELLVQGGLNRDREVIFLDQRGTLHSEPSWPARRSTRSPRRPQGCP